jgi:hypothetical protein
MSLAKKIPIEIVNKILIYVGELNDEVVIIQYNTNLNFFYKINFYSNFFFDLKGLILMKRFYPVLFTSITNYTNIELYKWGKSHYKIAVKQNENKYIKV